MKNCVLSKVIGGFISDFEASPVFIIDTVDVDSTEGEADVDNEEDEEEDDDIHNHVAHRDDDRARLSVHQPRLQQD